MIESITKHYKLMIFLILTVSFLISLYSVYLISQKEDLIKIEETYMPDFQHQTNIIKGIAETGKIPLYVKGLTENENVWHSPLYYYLAAPIYKLTNSILSLHILSSIIMLITNILFLLFLNNFNLKKITKIYSLALFSFLPTHLYLTIMITEDPLFYLTLVLTLYIFSKFIKQPDKKHTIFLGLSLTLSLLSKLSAIILFLALPIFLLIKKFRKQISTSLIIGVIFGSYPLIRNFYFFGKIMPAGTQILKNPYVIIRSFIAFWGGIWGSLEIIKPILYIIIIALILLTIFYLIKYHNFQNHNLNLVLLIAIINIILGIHWNCNFLIFVKSLKCMSIDATVSRYLLSIEPAIAIFSSISLTKLFKNKTIPSIFIILTCLLFALDFIYALI